MDIWKSNEMLLEVSVSVSHLPGILINRQMITRVIKADTCPRLAMIMMMIKG